MAVIGSLSVKLGLVTVEWDKATAKAKQDAKQLQTAFNDLGNGVKGLSNAFRALGGGLGVATLGFGGLLASTLSFASAVKDTAQGFGISIAKTLQFREALMLGGKSADDAQKIMGKLFSTIEEARDGNEATISRFQELGISFDELRRMSPEQSLNRVFQALAGIDNVYKRIKATKDLLGKSGIGVNPEDVAQKLGMSLNEFKKYEKSLEDFEKLADTVEISMNNLKIAFAELFAPFTPDLVIGVEKFKLAMVGIGSFVVVSGIVKLTVAVMALVKAMRAGAIASAIMSGGLTTIAGLAGAGALTALFAYMDKDLEAPTDISADEPVSAPVTTSAKRPELESLQKKLQYLKEIGQLQVQEIYMKNQINTLSTFDKEMADIKLDTEKKRAEIEQKRVEDLAKNEGKSGLLGTINQIYDQEIRNLDLIAEARRRVAEQNESNRQSFTYGWSEAFRKFADDAKDSAKVAGDMFNSITSNMNSAIDNFVRNGKLSFKDFTRSVIQDLIAIQLKAQAMKMFSGLGSIFGSMGTASQFGTTAGSQQTMMLQAQMAGFADGGSPPVGVPSIVGERGAELFIPKQAGTIIPNNQLSSVLGTGTTINYNAPVVENLSAIDTQSGMQFLMKNKESIWSANQSASRSLPASR
jgi:lambda family phage tail tape measure protein